MTFEAIVSAGTLTDYLEPVSALVDECIIHLEPDGLRIAAVDPANVAMIETTLDAGAFESYEADGGRLGINLDAFEDVLALADSGNLVWLELDDYGKLDIRFDEVDYTQALIDPDTIRQEPDIPDLDLPAQVVIEGEKLDRGVTAADLCSDHITLGAQVNTDYDSLFVFDAHGDTDDVQVEYESGDLIDADLGESVQSLFSLDYVTDVVGVIDDETEVRCRVGNELPTRVEYDHCEGSAAVTVLISPRIAGDN